MQIQNPIQKYRKAVQGFSLAELMIAVAIMLILATVGTSTYTVQLKRGRDQQRKSDIAKIQAALEEYYAEYGEYPPDAFNLDSSAGAGGAGSAGTLDTWHANSALRRLIGEDVSIGGNPPDGKFGEYMDELPVDPKNDDEYYYAYEVTWNRITEPEGDFDCEGVRYHCKPYSNFCMYTLRVDLETEDDEYCVESVYSVTVDR